MVSPITESPVNGRSVSAATAIFFDFDGVLVDSVAIKSAAFERLFADYDAELVARILAYHRLHNGISRVEKIRFAHQEIIGCPLPGNELERWAQRYAGLVFELVVAAAWVDGARDFLDRVYRHVPIFLVSGTPLDELAAIVERRGMSKYFVEVCGSPTLKADHLRRLLRTYRIDASRAVFIGDALIDHHAARETGLHFIGIARENTFPVGTEILPDCRNLQALIEKSLGR